MFDIIKNKIEKEIHEGNRHNAIRDIGRTIGGYLAGGALSQFEVLELKQMIINQAGDFPAEKEFESAIQYGKNEPLYKNNNQNIDKIVDQAIKDFFKKPEKEIKKHYYEDETSKYLKLLFKESEYCSIVAKSAKKDNKYNPAESGQLHKISDLLEDLKTKSIESILKYNHAAGCWIRFNPLDGNGNKDQNITSYRYALVESDKVDLEEQLKYIKSLNLPCACIVSSAGKSYHAIVKIYAKDKKEYQERVKFLYNYCKSIGFAIDDANKNPSRLSRIPGVMRGNYKQSLIHAETGAENWLARLQWIEEQNDKLPPIETVPDELPPLADELIENTLRCGHKMLISAPAKAGKAIRYERLL